jgi:hypothetical protein
VAERPERVGAELASWGGSEARSRWCSPLAAEARPGRGGAAEARPGRGGGATRGGVAAAARPGAR